MNENSITITAPTTPENNANSSIHKVKSGVSNKIFNSLSNSLSKWFSPSDQNGNLSRKRECESDIEVNEMTPGSTVAPTSIKRFRSEHDEIESHPTTSKNLYSTRTFSSSTPTLTQNRRMLGTLRNSAPNNFGDQSIANTRLKSHKTTTTTFEDNGENSSDDEMNTNDDVVLSDSYTNLRSNRKCLNIPPTTRPGISTNKLYLMRTSSVPRNHCPSANRIANDDTEQEASFNGILNESASESEDSSSRITFTQPIKHASKRPQSSAGRINTSLVRDDETDLQRRPSGLFGTCSKRSRPSNNELLNFSAHLQTKKSLFSEKNMPNSLNNSTTSLNSLNRRQSLNTSLYGSTSALSDSHTTDTNSPFYNGRTMYGGASGYPRRAISVQRPLRVPTQIRPSSSLSTLYSSTNSLANVEPNTSALSSTAKRILDLMNQCTTPLHDVKKMANNVTNYSPVLVNHRKRFDDNDLMLNRSMRLSTPKTPYSRPGVNNARKSPPTNELQVPSMSQLLQMKKTLQNNTEKVREIATASNSILNQTGEYKLPNNNNSTSVSQGKWQNKISTRGGVKYVEEENVQEVNLPNISLPIMKDIPNIGMPQFECISWLGKTKTIVDVDQPMKQPTSSLPAVVVTEATQNKLTKEVHNVPTTKSQFSFSSPTEVKMPSFGKNIEPVNNFKFSEPINVEKSKNALIQSDEKQVKEPCRKTLSQLKNTSVLEALNIPKTSIGSSTTSTLSPAQQSLSLMFKSSSKQWECSCCMIRNDDSKDKCAACETPRNKPPQKTEQIASVPLANSFGSQFKASTNTWECSSCMIRNKLDVQKCVACETAKPAAIEKSPSSLPILTVSNNDQGFKALVAQQSARWECTACMTRNDASRKKCECCEQAKPGTCSDKTPSFNFGSSSALAQKFSFGVPFNEKAASAVIPINETKAKIGEIKSTFSFGVQPNVNETDGPVKTFSFGHQTKANVEEKKKDATGNTFSFGVQQSNTSNQNEFTASNKIVSTPAVSGFKFSASPSISQNRPVTTVTFGSSNSKSTADDNVTETKSNELVFGSKNENIFKAPLNNTSGVVIPLSTTTTNSAITFGSPKNDQKIPVFGTPTSKADSIVNTIAQTKSPSFALPTTTLAQLSATQSISAQSISNTTIPSKTAPVFAFGHKDNAAKGALFTSVPAAPDKQALHKPDFTQSKTKSTIPALSFGSSPNVTVTTAAPITNSSSFFVQPATAGGFSFAVTSASIQPNAFGAQPQQAATANTITSSLPTEPATSSFLFRSTPPIEATPSFGQAPTAVQPSPVQPSPVQPSPVQPSPVQPFGFGSQAQTPAASFSAFGSTLTNNSTPSAFGTASPFGPTGNATTFGSTGNNGLSTFVSSNSLEPSTPSGFGSMIRSAPPSSDEPSAKKAHSPGFGSLSNTVRYGNTAEGFIDIDKQKPPAFSFGDSSNNNNAKKSFAFSATASPSFNFSGSQQTNSAQPYNFGSTAAPAGAFNFGSGSTEANSPNAPFQFAGSSDVTNNLFAPQPAVQQRRKIRAVRRNPR